MNLDKLVEITDLRTIWPHEALDFTPWLADENNIALLSDAIGIDITVDETESNVGTFHVDIVGKETGGNKTIIIENQLEDTNHDHLGKLITYASGKDADIIIWVVKNAREEHRAAIEWLNNHTDDKINFFLCEIKLYKIGNSNPAVKFEVIERPNDWSKEIKKANIQQTTPRRQKRQEYWQALQNFLAIDKQYTKEFRLSKPSGDHWYTLRFGNPNCYIAALSIWKRQELNIEFCIPDNKTLYQKLFLHKDDIEKEFGEALEWLELPSKKASRILAIKKFDVEDESDWNNQFKWLKENTLKYPKTHRNT